MIIFIIKIVAVLGALSFVAWLNNYYSSPNSGDRSLETVAAIALTIFVPTAIGLIMMAIAGKWAGVFFVCALITTSFAVSATAFRYAKAHHMDAITIAGSAIIFTPLIVGGPLAIALLP